jgi:hypothetical protein
MASQMVSMVLERWLIHQSTRAIWVPKFLLTNIEGPNKTWVPELA